MDQERFDDLTRALATGMSRRQALKLIGGGLAGTLLALVGFNPVDNGPPTASALQAQGQKDVLPLANNFVCPHQGQVVCYGLCCRPGGTCVSHGHGRGVSCSHGGCCSLSQTCCESLDRLGRFSTTCCSANQTCITTHGPSGTYIGLCRQIEPLL